ncbi:MAG: M1 family aminopeptidase [Candidatus Acidiferrales bacterium]
MIRNALKTFSSLLLASLPLICLAGCNVPLAPGYRVEKQSLDVQYLAGSPPRIAVRAGFQLRNTGSTELTSLDAILPSRRIFATQDSRILLGGRAISPSPIESPAAAETRGDDVQVPFDPPWPRNSAISLVFEYTLAPPPPGHGSIAVNDDSFHLNQGGWMPQLETPKKIFAHDIDRPDPEPVNFRVPADFSILSGGRFKGSKKMGGELEYRFRLGKSDLDPYAIAGRYLRQTVQASGISVNIWTFEPLPESKTSAAGTELARAMNIYSKNFGPLPNWPASIWLVETPARIRSYAGTENEPAARAFPGGVLLNRQAFASGVESFSFLNLSEHALAHSWMGEEILLRPEAQLAMGEGFAQYAPIVLDESSGGAAARRKVVSYLIHEYDDARVKAVEKPLRALTEGDPWEQRRFAYTKGPLFFIALEDQCGEAGARKGIAHMIQTLRGQIAGYDTLRSALELQTGQDLGAFFRTWLDEKGIPEDFRKSYESN